MLRICMFVLATSLGLGATAPAAAQTCWDYAQGGWPARATLLGPGPLGAVALTDDGRLVGAFADGVAFYDLTDPAAPVMVDFLRTAAPVRDVAALGDRVLAVSEDDVLWYGIMSAGLPVAWSDTLPVGAPVDRVSLDRDIAALIVDGAALVIVDLADPKNLRLAGSAVTPSDLFDVVADRGFVYAGSRYDGFYVYDATDPDLPRLRGDSGIVLMTGNAVALRYPVLYVGNYNNIWIFDIGSPQSPQLLGTSDTIGPFMVRIAVSKDRVFGISEARQLVMYRQDDPGTLTLLGHAPLPSLGRDLAARDDYVYTAVTAGGGLVHDRRDAVHPGFVQQVLERRLRIQDFHGERAYLISDDDAGSGLLEVMAVSAGDTLAQLGSLPVAGSPVAITATDEYVFFSSDLTDLTSVDVSDPFAPRYLGIAATRSVPRGLFVVGDGVYVGSNSQGLVGYDVSDPTRLVVAGAVALPRTQQAWATMGRYGLIGLRGDLNGVLVVDCADPRLLQVASWVAIPGPVWDLIAVGDRAYVADDDGRIHVVDLHEPATPRVTGSLAVGSGRGRLSAYGRDLLYADDVLGIVVLDASTATLPAVSGASLVPLSWTDIYATTAGIFLPDIITSGIARLPVACGALAAAPVPATVRLGLAASPNPFNPRTVLAFELPRGTTVSLTIHDVRGRTVRTLLAGVSLPPGRQEVNWDGRDNGGRDVPSGIYLARLVGGRERATTRLALVR